MEKQLKLSTQDQATVASVAKWLNGEPAAVSAVVALPGIGSVRVFKDGTVGAP